MNTITITISTRYRGGSYIARGNGKTCSSTSAERHAVEGVVFKLGLPKEKLACLEPCVIGATGWLPGRWAVEF